MHQKIEKRLNDMPQVYRNNYKKAMSEKKQTCSSQSILFRVHGMGTRRSQKM